MTPADAAAARERAARVHAEAKRLGGSFAYWSPHTVAELAADVVRATSALRKLRWCVAHERDGLAAKHVTWDALEAWLRAHGWQRHHAPDDWGGDYARDWQAWVNVPRPPGGMADVIDDALARIAGEGFPAALVLAELLPAAGPWDDDGGSE